MHAQFSIFRSRMRLNFCEGTGSNSTTQPSFSLNRSLVFFHHHLLLIGQSIYTTIPAILALIPPCNNIGASKYNQYTLSKTGITFPFRCLGCKSLRGRPNSMRSFKSRGTENRGRRRMMMMSVNLSGIVNDSGR